MANKSPLENGKGMKGSEGRITKRRAGRPTPENIRLRMSALLQIARAQFCEHGYHKASMDRIANAAGVTKRTLYLWHQDKESLFNACLLDGAGKFPLAPKDSDTNIELALVTYLTALLEEFATKEAFGMAKLIMRERDEFPGISAQSSQNYQRYVVQPLAGYLRAVAIETKGSTFITEALLELAQSPTRNAMILGSSLPKPRACREHIERVVAFFLQRQKIKRR